MSDRGMRVAFFVQGEGRGHMTQALALARILRDAGHEVVGAFMGEDPARPIPPFFHEEIGAPVVTYPFPVFLTDHRRRGVVVGRSVAYHLRRFGRYWSQGPRIDRAFRALRPHLLVNFHDLMGGLYHFLYRPGVEMVGIAHHYLMGHPAVPPLPERRGDLALARLYSAATSFSARLRIALSFRELPDLPERRLVVAPPLLRPEVLRLADSPVPHEDGRGPLLAYLLNSGYAEDLREWHARHPEVEIHCFWDRPDAPPSLQVEPGLTFHRLHGRLFLEFMSRCRGYAGTAGFEAVCEAAYLGRPALVVPTAGHVEQLFNAVDAERAGLARWEWSFDLDLLLEARPPAPERTDTFRRWVRAAPERIVRLIEVAAGVCPVGAPDSLPAARTGRRGA